VDGSLRSTCSSREETDVQDATPVQGRGSQAARGERALAEELGLHINQLRMWRNEHLAAGSAEALARQKAEAAELARLRRENKRLEQENEILRRAAAFSPGRRPPS
jgi:transposase